jgi:hypothetical protein
MTPDLWVLAVLTALCCLLVAAFGIAERQRFTAAPGRHRRHMSRRLWAVKTGPVVTAEQEAPVTATVPPWRHGPLVLTVDLGYLGTRSVVL